MWGIAHTTPVKPLLVFYTLYILKINIDHIGWGPWKQWSYPELKCENYTRSQSRNCYSDSNAVNNSIWVQYDDITYSMMVNLTANSLNSSSSIWVESDGMNCISSNADDEFLSSPGDSDVELNLGDVVMEANRTRRLQIVYTNTSCYSMFLFIFNLNLKIVSDSKNFN